MSKLAASLDEVELERTIQKRHAACWPLYGAGDQEDKDSVDKLREKQITWDQIQKTIDELLEIPEKKKLNIRKFIRHWRGECSCWDTQNTGV